MKKHVVIILEVIFVLAFCFIYCLTTIIPEYKEKFGSSDGFIKTDNFANMFEFKVEGADFILVANSDEIVYHLFFLEEKSCVLYNRNIEGSNLKEVFSKIIPLLIDNKIINNKSVVTIIRYNDDYYDDVKNSLITTLNKYHLNSKIVEEMETISNKSQFLFGEVYTDEKEFLQQLDLYSKNISGTPFSSKEKEITKLTMNEEDFVTLSKKVYKKIENYVYDNNISNLDKEKVEFKMSVIPVKIDGGEFFYPTDNSWYYVKDGKVNAYIEFLYKDKNYMYCYKGSIDSFSKGMC